MNYEIKEEWRPIEGYPNYYVSNTGKVKHWNKELIPYSNGCGYLVLRVGGKYFSVHRLVADTFIPNPENLPCVHHIDHNKTNNVVTNLSFCTHARNNADNRKSPGGVRFKKPVIIVELNKRFESIGECARFLNVTTTAVQMALQRKNGKCQGYTVQRIY